VVAPEIGKQLEAWLEAFAAAVRSAETPPARTLFAPSLRGFGTRVFDADGRDAVEREQWRHVWPSTRGFAFELDALSIWLSPDARQACLALPWRSTGLAPDGARFERRGRATLVLARDGGGDWLGVHTHFSVDPDARHPTLAAAVPD
jgi:ketosteroid isomerase-like protein